MDVIWWWVVIVACLAVAAVIVAVFTVRRDADRRRFRPLANTARLTTLPAYVRAVRRRNLVAAVTLALLVAGFGGAVLAAARPIGLPSLSYDVGSAQPEDIMVCTDGPGDDESRALRYFAERIGSFDTERIGLTTPDRRIVPLTRDRQFAVARFDEAGRTDTDGSAVRYSDYTPTVEDLIALCITGFPDFEQPAAQRRSVVYVGPARLAGDDALFDSGRLRDLTAAAGVQFNAVTTDVDSAELQRLAADTGGTYHPPGSDIAAALADIRDRPPSATSVVGPSARAATPETPELPLLVALLALTGLLAVPLVVRR